MFWTRNANRVHASRATLALAVAAAAGLGGGCTKAPQARPEAVSTAPLAIDEAMQRRGDWPRVAAEFQAGGVDAGVTRFPYQPRTEGPDAGRAILGNERINALLDPLFFVGQSIVLPFTYIPQLPFTKANHRGVIYEPTYTAMPLLPPDQEPGPGVPPPPAAGAAPPRDSANARAEGLPAPEETAPVTPDAAEASDAPNAPEDAPLEIRPEDMPGDSGLDPTADPETAPATEAIEPMPESSEPAPPESTDPAPEAIEPAPETSEPATEPAPPEPVDEPAPDSADENK